MQTLPEYLTQKFLDWQAAEGERKTLEDFADFLDVNRSLLSYWMNGSRIPSEKNVDKIAVKFGNDIYEILDLPRPNPYLQKVNRLWEFIPEEVQRRLAEQAEEYETQNQLSRAEKTHQRRKTRKAQ